MRSVKIPLIVVLAALGFWYGCEGRGFAESITRSTEYISPYGDYDSFTARKTLVTGVAATAAGTPANSGQSTFNIYGNLFLQGGTLDSSSNLQQNGKAEVDVDETLIVQRPGGYLLPAFATYPKNPGASHWFGINLDPAFLKQETSYPAHPDYEFEVNGNIYASALWASPGTIARTGASDNDYLLYFKTNNTMPGSVASVDIGSSVQILPSVASPAGGYGIQESVARFTACPKIVINGKGSFGGQNYSDANVLIGTYTPQGTSGAWGTADQDPLYKLQVGSAGSGLYAICHDWQTFSSREFKEDISLLSTSDMQMLYSKIDQMEIVRYHYKEVASDSRLRIGIIAEDAPKELVTGNGKGISTINSIGFLVSGIQQLYKENQRLEKIIADLERQTAALESKNRRI